MSVEAYDKNGLTRGIVCASCLSLKSKAADICKKCGCGPTADDVLAELIHMDRDKSIRIKFDPLPHDGASVDKTVGGHVYRIIRLR